MYVDLLISLLNFRFNFVTNVIDFKNNIITK